MEEDARGPLFQGVVFTIILGNGLGEGFADSLIDALDDQGGRFVPVRPSDREIDDLDEITHIITTSIDFPQYSDALQHGIDVVKPSWVKYSMNKGKLASARQHSPDPSQYFQDVIVTFGTLPDGDQDAIIAGVIALGGMHTSPLSKLATHIVTNDLDNEKCRTAEEKGLKAHIVLPHWFDDCLRLGRKISEGPYLFPDPELLRRWSGTPTKIKAHYPYLMEGAFEATPSELLSSSAESSPSTPRKSLNVLMYKKIMLGKDLPLDNGHLRKTLEGLITYSGATFVEDAEEANIYIGAYRDGPDYVKASRAGKEVANLSWLYHVINCNKYTPPTAKLLHYPVPREGLPGFSSMKISLSNYSGDARIYLRNLIEHSGAEYTNTMKQDNTHLITAHQTSEKCEAAQEWNVNIVNHIWLEESYAKCAAQSLTNPRYSHFPARTNLGEVAGQTRFDMKRVEQMFFSKPRLSPKKAMPPPTTSKGSVSSKKAAAAPSTVTDPTDTPTPLRVGDDSGFDEPSTSKKARGRPRRSATATPRVVPGEKENESPLSRSSARASKEKAAGLIHDNMQDVALFDKEMKRKGGVTHGGRRESNADELSSPAPAMLKPRKKRTSDEATYDVTAIGSDLSDGETQGPNAKPPKRAKHTAAPELPPVRYKMMVTGDERWMNSRKQEDLDRRTLRQLGVLLTVDPKEVQILVAPQIKRTRKFVSALACAPLVVDIAYLNTALKEDKLLDDPPPLEDPENEERYGFKLSEALSRAKINNGRLFHGWTVYITRDVSGGIETHKEVVTLNGGTPTLYQGRLGLTLRPLQREDGPQVQHQGGEDELRSVYLVSGDSDAEKRMWKTFKSSAVSQGLEPRIVKHDWLLNSAMHQEIVWDEERYAVPGA